MEEDIVVKKEKLNKIDFLYIASMVLFALAFLAIRSPIVDIKYDDNVLLSDVWFSAISLYSLGGIICYILGLIKIRKYNNNPKLNDPEMKYKIIHFCSSENTDMPGGSCSCWSVFICWCILG